ncbi:MAG: sigma-70 family RNA polymerase sigma factor [Planctomycetota bacterium]
MNADRTNLRRARRGNDPAARSLWASHAPRLLAYATRALDAASADDVVQSVFCRVWELPTRTIDAVDDPRAWLTTLTRRAIADHVRKPQTRRSRRAPELVITKGNQAEHNDDDLARALACVTPDDRDRLLLKHVAGLTIRQLADVLGEAASTAADRLARAEASLREAFIQQSEPADPDPTVPAATVNAIPARSET